MCIDNILIRGNVSQIFCLRSSFYLKQRKTRVIFVIFFVLVKVPSSIYNKTKTKPYIKILRHFSLQTTYIQIFKHISAIISEISMFKKYYVKNENF